MKKSLYITIGLVLCAGILVTGALLRGKPDDITPPDGTQDITPDNTQNVISDTTADDNKTPDTPTPPAQDDPTPPVQDDPTPPAQDDNKDKPDDNNDPADNTKPDDTQKLDEVVAVDYFASFDTSKYDYSTNENNIKAVQAYYDFLFNNTEAYDTYTSKFVSLVDVAEDAYPRQSFWVNLQNLELAFVDFGADGVVEMVFNDGNRFFKNWVILFYEDDQLYLDTVNHRSMGGIRKNGFYDSYAFFSSSFSVDGGQSDVSLFACSTSTEYPYDKKYYTYFEIADGDFVPTERTEITEIKYQSLLAAYNKVPKAVWYSVTDTFESLLLDANHLMIFADINNQPTTMYNPK